MLTVGSLFAGIGGMDLGLEWAGMRILWQVEIDQRCQGVLARHWPDVRRYSDVRECGKHNLEPVDLICGGFPCQDLSVAGKRAGLAGERSGLWFEFARIVEELDPQWVVVENVPGLLSSGGGADFAAVIGCLAERGYGVVWRILNTQYFGVAQRRRRVFIVGHFGDGRASEVLFEPEGMSRDTPPRREKGQAVAYTLGRGTSSGYRYAPDEDFIVARPVVFGSTVDHYDESQQTYVFSNGQGDPNGKECDVSYALDTEASQGMAYNWQSGGDVRLSFGLPNLQAGQVPAVNVRRLTPTECERLQGFPDGFTDGQSDSACYKQLGNAVCVPVAEWIGRRIMEAMEA